MAEDIDMDDAAVVDPEDLSDVYQSCTFNGDTFVVRKGFIINPVL